MDVDQSLVLFGLDFVADPVSAEGEKCCAIKLAKCTGNGISGRHSQTHTHTNGLHIHNHIKRRGRRPLVDWIVDVKMETMIRGLET